MAVVKGIVQATLASSMPCIRVLVHGNPLQDGIQIVAGWVRPMVTPHGVVINDSALHIMIYVLWQQLSLKDHPQAP